MNRMFKIYDNINDLTLKLVLEYCVLKYKNEAELLKQEQFREFEMKICLHEFKYYNISLNLINRYMNSYANALHCYEDNNLKANNVYNLLIENIFIDNYIHHTYRYLNAKKVIIQYLEIYYENENIIEKTKAVP